MKLNIPSIPNLLAASLVGIMTIVPSIAAEKPVKVYILSGQSNMVGIGQVDGGGVRIANEITDTVLSMYAGAPDAAVDYDTLKAVKTIELKAFGGSNPEPYPTDGVAVLRGQFAIPVTGIYEFRPGYGASEECIMTVKGTEVHRKEPGKEAIRKAIKLEAGVKVPFKITHLNQSGSPIGWYARMDIPGTLKTLVNHEGKFPYLINDKGAFVPRNDVWYKGVVTAAANKWLDIGCGAANNSIGPELGFGHLVGNAHDEPVLILKASQGNRSLGWDFLPPGSESYEAKDETGETWVHAGYKQSPERWKKDTTPAKLEWYAGKQYDDCFNEAKALLAKFDESFPQWKGRGYEVAGFGWWQGHKDGGEQGTGTATIHAARYEQNLTHLIKTLRKEFNAPNAPFVVATCGFNGGKGWEAGSSADTIFKAQMNVSDAAKHPDFAGSVKSVDTRSFYRAPEISPRDQSFHYHGNAETFMLVGEAMGKAMLEMQKK